MKLKPAFFGALALAAVTFLCARAQAACSDSQIDLQNSMNADIALGVPGGITPPTVNGLLQTKNNCYLNIETNAASAPTAHQRPQYLDASGIFHFAKPAIGDISGWGAGVASALGQAADRGIGEVSVISAANVGMVANTGFDNARRISALMNAISPTATGHRAGTIIFSAAYSSAVKGPDEYYFSKPLSLSRSAEYHCTGGNANIFGNSVALVFAPGVDGVVFEDASTSSDGGSSKGELSGCSIVSLGYGYGRMTNGGTSITNAGTYGSATIAAIPWAAGDAVIGGVPTKSNTAGINISQGAYVASVAGSAGAQTLNLAAGFTTTYAGAAQLWRLPANLAFSVTTTSGSATFTVTSGPFLLHPGDLIWSDAWPFGATVYTVSGSLGAQTVTVHDQFLTPGNSYGFNASVTHTNGSGKLWKIPAGVRHRSTSKTYDDTIIFFPIGRQLSCQAYVLNCTVSAGREDSIEHSIVGHWISGNNSSASVFTDDAYYSNLYADIAEFSSIGNTYVGEDSNSPTANSVIGNCYSTNSSIFLGAYIEMGTTWNFCVSPQISLSMAQVSSFVGPTAATPKDVPVFEGNVFLVNGKGLYARDTTYGCADIDGLTYGLYGLDTYCLSGEPYPTRTGWIYDSTHETWVNRFNASNSTEIASILLPHNAYYVGDGLGYFQLWRFIIGFGSNVELVAVDKTSAPPTTIIYPNSVQGDLHFNHTAVEGGSVGWVYDGSDFHPWGPISNSLTLRDYTFDVVRSGTPSNTDLTGRVTLSSGAYTLTLTGAYSSPPNCWTADVTTPASASYAVESTTQVVFHGVGNHVIKYGCVGRN